VSQLTKITKEHLEKLIDRAETETVIFWNNDILVSYKLIDRGNHTICGMSGAVDSSNFSYDVGVKIAREDALRQLAIRENYLLDLTLAGLVQTDF
jgi:hypothetical protein